VQVAMQATAELVSLIVVDQGIGIAAKDHLRIFERFYRVDRARSRSTGGSGLGLSIVRHVVSNHGGTVSVMSEEGRGSTFTVILPRASVDPGVASQNDALDPVAAVAPRLPHSAEDGSTTTTTNGSSTKETDVSV
jgi:two-component system sensor histidine kinase SenX3